MAFRREYSNSIASVTLWKARAVLIKHGIFNAADAYIEAHKDSEPDLYQAWNYGNLLSRGSNLVKTMQARLGISDEQLDAMFAEAAKSE